MKNLEKRERIAQIIRTIDIGNEHLPGSDSGQPKVYREDAEKAANEIMELFGITIPEKVANYTT